ncbi:hypothetical protein VUR80DRAFT_7458 [Thermomyces stellatus]
MRRKRALRGYVCIPPLGALFPFFRPATSAVRESRHVRTQSMPPQEGGSLAWSNSMFSLYLLRVSLAILYVACCI